jgi:hypothetical protein
MGKPRNAGLYHTHMPHWSSGRSSRGLMTKKRSAFISVSRSRIRVCTKLLTASDFCKAGPSLTVVVHSCHLSLPQTQNG